MTAVCIHFGLELAEEKQRLQLAQKRLALERGFLGVHENARVHTQPHACVHAPGRKRYANDTQTIRKRFAGFAIKRKHGGSIATMPFYYITDRVLSSEAPSRFRPLGSNTPKPRANIARDGGLSQREEQRAKSRLGAGKEPGAHRSAMDGPARRNDKKNKKACSKQWRDQFFVNLEDWVRDHGHQAPRTARAKGVPKTEAKLAQQLRDFRQSSACGVALSSEERARWERLADFVFQTKSKDAEALVQAQGVLELARVWLLSHEFLPNSKNKGGSVANTLVQRLLRLRANWAKLPTDVRSKFEQLAGWSWDPNALKVKANVIEQPPCRCKETWFDEVTEMHRETDVMEEAHPDRTAITRKPMVDYRVWLPHARPGCMTTTLTDMDDNLMQLLLDAKRISKGKRDARAAERQHTEADEFADAGKDHVVVARNMPIECRRSRYRRPEWPKCSSR